MSKMKSRIRILTCHPARVVSILLFLGLLLLLLFLILIVILLLLRP